jgi:hypothetical protein
VGVDAVGDERGSGSGGERGVQRGWCPNRHVLTVLARKRFAIGREAYGWGSSAGRKVRPFGRRRLRETAVASRT